MTKSWNFNKGDPIKSGLCWHGCAASYQRSGHYKPLHVNIQWNYRLVPYLCQRVAWTCVLGSSVDYCPLYTWPFLMRCSHGALLPKGSGSVMKLFLNELIRALGLEMGAVLKMSRGLRWNAASSANTLNPVWSGFLPHTVINQFCPLNNLVLSVSHFITLSLGFVWCLPVRPSM